MKSYVVTCDASYHDGRAGWAAVYEADGKTWVQTGAMACTDSNAAELFAIVMSISGTKEGSVVEVHTDSRGLLDSVNRVMAMAEKKFMRTRRKPQKHYELWKSLYRLCVNRKVTLKHIKGHNGHLQNERAHMLCGMARKKGSSIEGVTLIK